MSSGSKETWTSLLEDMYKEKSQLIKNGCRTSEDISSDSVFREEFETLCRRNKERRLTWLSSKLLLSSYGHILELVDGVTEYVSNLQDLAPRVKLEGLVWWMSYAAIEHGFQAGVKLDPLTTLLVRLNNKVPKFSTDIRQFPDDENVQTPLQEVYSLFIQSYAFIISSCMKFSPTSEVSAIQISPLENHVDETGKRLEEARGTYDMMVNHAAEDAEKRKMALEQPSLEGQRVLPNLLHPDSAKDREVQVSFVSLRRLGHGSFGEVDEVRELSTGASYARKHIHIEGDRSGEKVEEDVKNEFQIMQKPRHQHIATVLFYLAEEVVFSIFMLPVADKDLLHFLDDCARRGYPPAEIKRIYPWFGSLLEALAYAHKMKVKHRDIKPSNILIKNNQAYLCDFGLARDFTEHTASISNSDKVQGTHVYRAPEIQPQFPRGRKADVFSLGCVYSEMFTVCQGKSLDEYRKARQTEANSVEFRHYLSKVKGWLNQSETHDRLDLPVRQDRVDAVLVDQILSMMDADPDKRPQAQLAVNQLRPQQALFYLG